MSQTGIDAPDRHAVFVPVERTLHTIVFRTCDGGDTFVEDVTVAHEGEIVASVQEAAVADAVRPFDGEVEVMALLWFQIRIADDHITHITHVEMHIHLLERRSPETAGNL